MSLGNLELELLATLRNLEEVGPGALHRALNSDRQAQGEALLAYSTVTTTLHRLVAKGVVRARRESPKRVHYSVARTGPAFQAEARALWRRLLLGLGGESVSSLLEGPAPPAQELERLAARVGGLASPRPNPAPTEEEE